MKKTRIIFQYILLSLCLIGVIFLICTQNKIDDKNDVISNIKVHTKDEAIEISWNIPSKTNITNTIIEIKDINENIVDSYTIKANEESFIYKDGEINNCYLITLSASYKDGSKREIETDKRLYLDLDNLPDLPTMYIDTKSGDDPTADYITPNKYWGTTSTNAKYEKASMNYVAFGNNINSKLKIKIRGNFSSIEEKKPYKIVLDNPIDLTNSGKDYSHSEWVLLNSGDTLNNFLGETIAKESNVEWVTHGIYVNLILNGDYKGIYTLMEPVSQSASRGIVSEDGVIFENDLYFWNSDNIYFRLDNQYGTAYTFKYPKMNSSKDERLIKVHEYMQEFVDSLNENDEKAWEYADLDNFASYMIAKDLTSNSDSTGTNIFYYVNNFYSDNKTEIKIGPLWDFDGFACSTGDKYIYGKKYENNAYSSQHYIDFLPFVENKEFIEAYWDKWEDLSVNILDDIYSSLDDLYINQGEAINESRYLNSLRWSDGSYETIEEEMYLAKDWLYRQAEFLNNEMENR